MNGQCTRCQRLSLQAFCTTCKENAAVAAERARLVAVVRKMLETEALMSRGALRRVLEAMGATEEGSAVE